MSGKTGLQPQLDPDLVQPTTLAQPLSSERRLGPLQPVCAADGWRLIRHRSPIVGGSTGAKTSSPKNPVLQRRYCGRRVPENGRSTEDSGRTRRLSVLSNRTLGVSSTFGLHMTRRELANCHATAGIHNGSPMDLESASARNDDPNKLSGVVQVKVHEMRGTSS
jgi:hypothetical protein